MKWPFLNRYEEQMQFEGIVQNSKQQSAGFVHCIVAPASGVTAFLKHSSEKYQKENYSFYIDGSYKMPYSLVSQILTELFKIYPEELESFKEYFLNKYPNDLRGKGTALIGLIPYIGSFVKDYLKESIENNNLSQLQTLGYPSLIAEMICPFLNMLSDKKAVMIFVDNAQELDNWSLDILKSSISDESRGLNYFMAFVKRSDSEPTVIDDLLWKIKSLGVPVRNVAFEIPGRKLIKEFCAYKGLQVTESGVLKIAENSGGNIYKILTYVNNNGIAENADEALTRIQIELLGVLDVAGQPLRKSDLITIVVNSKYFFPGTLSEIESAFEILTKKNYILFSELPDGDITVQLQASSNPYINKFIGSEAERLLRARDLYQYFLAVNNEKSRHAKTEITLLLYRLSKSVDRTNTSKIAQDILSLSLKMGSAESAARYVDKAVITKGAKDIHDYFVKVAFYISLRKYSESLKMLLDLPDVTWKDVRIFKILLAISYNRCRFHCEAENLIQELITTTKHRSELSLLLSYSIAGHLHENNVSKARQVFLVNRAKIKGADNYGYFLRNASTAFTTTETATMLTEALSIFANTRDRFGYFSTLCNLGKTKCRLGMLNEAEIDLETAYEKLKIFGFHHLHIVLNNLGICKLQLGKTEEAESFFNRALVFAENAMPRIYSRMNMALTMGYHGKWKEAFELMKKEEMEVERFTFDRVKQKFYLNYSMIAFAAGEDKKNIHNIILKSKRYPDRVSHEFTLSRLQYITNQIEKNITYAESDFMSLADFCYLEYWYQNPIELLPTDLLPR